MGKVNQTEVMDLGSFIFILIVQGWHRHRHSLWINADVDGLLRHSIAEVDIPTKFKWNSPGTSNS